VPISLNEWHHFVCTYDDNKKEVAFYLDGVRTGTSPGHFWTVRSSYFVGASSGDEGRFDGMIDDVIVCSGTLTEQDVQTLYKRKEYSEAAAPSFDKLPECK
jgi:hypothetical protein